jgi:hypothetical protein
LIWLNHVVYRQKSSFEWIVNLGLNSLIYIRGGKKKKREKKKKIRINSKILFIVVIGFVIFVSNNFNRKWIKIID